MTSLNTDATRFEGHEKQDSAVKVPPLCAGVSEVSLPSVTSQGDEHFHTHLNDSCAALRQAGSLRQARGSLGADWPRRLGGVTARSCENMFVLARWPRQSAVALGFALTDPPLELRPSAPHFSLVKWTFAAPHGLGAAQVKGCCGFRSHAVSPLARSAALRPR